MSKQVIRIKLKSYDARMLDNAVKQIITDIIKTGAKIAGPIALPNKRRVWAVLRGPHIDVKSKEHFQLVTHSRLLEIIDSNTNTMDTLQKITDLPSGVVIEKVNLINK